MVRLPRIGRLRFPRRLTQGWRARLRAQRRWWRARRRSQSEGDLLFPTAGAGMVAVETLTGVTEAPQAPRIAILHATAGAGHHRAAVSLAQAFERLSPGITVREVDTLVFASRLYRGTYAASYNAMAARAPKLWGVLYHSWALAPVNRGTAPVRLALDRLNLRRLVRVLDREQPDAVVCTHFLPVEALSPIRGGGRLGVPLYCVITDFTAHPFWAFPHVDRYFVASEGVARELAGHGVPADRIEVTGIPVDPKFAQPIGRAEARARLRIGADDDFVLIMGGGRGVGPLADLAERLAALPTRPKVWVVCGTNARLRREVAALPAARAGRVTAIGFTHEVDALLEACDLVVSKAGGLTCSEALIKRAPLVVFRPTPGQEVRNAEYLESQGAARHANSIEEVEMVAQEWLSDPARREAVRAAQEKLAAPHAAMTIAERVLERLPSARDRVAAASRRAALTVGVAVALALGATAASAAPSGKLQLQVHRMEPQGQDAERFSGAAWGGGLSALASLRNIHHMLAGEFGLEYTNFLSETTEFRDQETGLRVEQQTNQHYFRAYVGPRVGLHGNGFIRPYFGTHLAFVWYGISTDVVIPDDTDRENEIRQSLSDENRTAAGYDISAGLDWNIANKVPIETGVRFVKSFNVPQQLGDGSVEIHPAYLQYYVAVGLNFPVERR